MGGMKKAKEGKEAISLNDISPLKDSQMNPSNPSIADGLSKEPLTERTLSQALDPNHTTVSGEYTMPTSFLDKERKDEKKEERIKQFLSVLSASEKETFLTAMKAAFTDDKLTEENLANAFKNMANITTCLYYMNLEQKKRYCFGTPFESGTLFATTTDNEVFQQNLSKNDTTALFGEENTMKTKYLKHHRIGTKNGPVLLQNKGIDPSKLMVWVAREGRKKILSVFINNQPLIEQDAKTLSSLSAVPTNPDKKSMN
jgi:hypothetical protein